MNRILPLKIPITKFVILALSVVFIILGFSTTISAKTKTVSIIQLHSIISPISESYLKHSINEAIDLNSELLIVELNTPGGLLNSTRNMVGDIINSPIPIVIYVSPSGGQAASAGTFLMAASHVAAMAPATSIGAASPIQGQGSDLEGTLKSKAFEDAAAEMRSLAEKRSRPKDVLESTVWDAKAFSAEEALDLGIIEYIATNVDDLLKQIHGIHVEVIRGSNESTIILDTNSLDKHHIRMGFFTRVFTLLADPNIAFLFLSLGGLGLYAEFRSPGLIFPGVCGAIALILGFMALGNLPTNWAGVALILIGFSLAIAEIFMDGFGIAGVLGIVSFLLGSSILFMHFGTPSPMQLPMSLRMWVFIPTTVIVSLAIGIPIIILMIARKINKQVPLSHIIGSIGTSLTKIDVSGKVRVKGETWSARPSSSSFINKGALVRVLREEKGFLYVTEINDVNDD